MHSLIASRVSILNFFKMTEARAPKKKPISSERNERRKNWPIIIGTVDLVISTSFSFYIVLNKIIATASFTTLSPKSKLKSLGYLS